MTGAEREAVLRPPHIYKEYALAQDYTLGCPDGEWSGQLDCRVWGKKASKGSIMIYFTDLDTGKKWCFSVFWNDEYKPRDGSFDFRNDGYLGEKFLLTTRHNPKSGNPVFQSARRKHDHPRLIAFYKRHAEILLQIDRSAAKDEAIRSDPPFPAAAAPPDAVLFKINADCDLAARIDNLEVGFHPEGGCYITVWATETAVPCYYSGSYCPEYKERHWRNCHPADNCPYEYTQEIEEDSTVMTSSEGTRSQLEAKNTRHVQK